MSHVHALRAPRPDPWTLSVVTAAYNEAEVIGQFVEAVTRIATSCADRWELVIVDDGSLDGTVTEVLRRADHDRRIKLVRLARNFGKEAALVAGLRYATGSVVIPMDCDLQDDPAVIPDMVAAWRDGADVAVGVRRGRDERWGKRWTARIFYWLLQRFCRITLDHRRGEFRAMDRRVIDDFLRLAEVDRWNKGLMEWVARRVVEIPFDRPARAAGATKFPLGRMVLHALDGITSVSVAPLRLVFVLGAGLFGIVLLYLLVSLTRIFLFGVPAVPGWLSLIIAVIAIGSLQLMATAVVGEYIGRAFIESKRRPLYLVDTSHGFERRPEQGDHDPGAALDARA